MDSTKIDRRIKYTRALLRDALAEMMQTQHISSISIKALCELADVHRSTFYAHYTDQYDLLNKIEQEVLQNLQGYLSRQDLDTNQPVSVQIMTKILDYIKENANLFKALLSENCDFTFQKAIMELAQIISTQMQTTRDSRIMDYMKEFGTNGCVSVLQKWLRDGMPEPSEKLAELIIQLMFFGFHSIQ